MDCSITHDVFSLSTMAQNDNTTLRISLREMNELALVFSRLLDSPRVK